MLESDFLSVPIGDRDIASPTETFLKTKSFDVVVFSLLLSYLPLSQQRLECCCRAHRLLRLHGLLLVIVPDSSHQNKHVAMMKDWKTCIEAIGFHRWKYYKDTHLHCMAFRKTQPRSDYNELLEKSCYCLYIPQDRNSKHVKQSETRNAQEIIETFSQMPFYDQSDDK